ncbi:hypothetical protein V490_04734, partial [Pseudogymnoascus sp. VKM F-3557]
VEVVEGARDVAGDLGVEGVECPLVERGEEGSEKRRGEKRDRVERGEEGGDGVGDSGHDGELGELDEVDEAEEVDEADEAEENKAIKTMTRGIENKQLSTDETLAATVDMKSRPSKHAGSPLPNRPGMQPNHREQHNTVESTMAALNPILAAILTSSTGRDVALRLTVLSPSLRRPQNPSQTSQK